MTQDGEHPFYFGPPGERMLGVLHRPPAQAPQRNAAWLICAAFGEERSHSQRLQIEWARVLCQAGFWVLRFDYRGYGDSDGVFEDHVLEDHLSDIKAAVQQLERRTGVPCRGLSGMRMGATLAALTAVRGVVQDPFLLLWEPVVDGHQYADELLRSVMARQMSRARSAPVTRDEMKENLAKGGTVVVEGHVLNQRVFESLCAVNLLKSPRPGKGPVLVLHIANRLRKKAPPLMEQLCTAYAEGGSTAVEYAHLPLPWTETDERNVKPAVIFDPSLQWLESHAAALAGGAPSEALVAGGTVVAAEETRKGGPHPEQVVGFAIEGKRVWGTLLVPEDLDPSRPVIIMNSMAYDPRAAVSRFYVKLARRLGRHGWASLRFDPRGVGDSGGELSLDTRRQIYLAIQRGLFVPDASAAIDFVQQELGARSFILAGLCGGAITAIFQAARDTRVAGLASLELATLYTPQSRLAQGSLQVRRSVREFLATHRMRVSQYLWRFSYSLYRRYQTLRRPGKGSRPPMPQGRVRRPMMAFGPRTNAKLLRALLRCLERGVPSLCLFAGNSEDAQAFDGLYPELHRVYPDQIEYYLVEDADHLFSEPKHTEQVVQRILAWLSKPGQPWAASAGESPAQKADGADAR